MNIEEMKNELQKNFDELTQVIESNKKIIADSENKIAELNFELCRLQGEYRMLERFEKSQCIDEKVEE